MDKETLSNYGWIVICILVLSVMIALASPFGQYVSDAVASTTNGLFETEKNALAVVGMDVDNGTLNGDGTISPTPRTEPKDHGAVEWETLISASEDGSYESKYIVGDTVTLTMKDSSTAQFRIVGIDHDDLADGTGKAHLTLISENTLAKHNINEENTNAGGWKDSAMRTYLEGNPFIPDTVAGSIKSVSKESFDYNGGRGGISQTTSDKLWIPSLTEVGFTGNTKIEGGSAYAYFTDDASRIKKGVNYMWWLRSARSGNGTEFGIVNSPGNCMFYSPAFIAGVALGFCI